MASVKLWAAILLAYTAAMIVLHLGSAALLRRAWSAPAPRWLSAVNIVRFEAVYYVLLAAFVAVRREPALLWAAAILALIHIGGWAVLEGRRNWLASPGFLRDGTLTRWLAGIQIFDWAEALALVWIGWTLFRMVVSSP